MASQSDDVVAETKKAKEAKLLQKMVDELTQSPLAANVSFGFVLMAIERLLAMQFECPCNTWNQLSASLFFVVPASLAVLLMLAISIRKCTCGDPCSMFQNAVTSGVPAVIWLVLLLLDGRYLACALTDWEGRFVEIKGSAPQKWCQPPGNATVPCWKRRGEHARVGTREDCMLKSQGFTAESQWFGIILLAGVGVLLLCYILGKHFRKHEDKKEKVEPSSDPAPPAVTSSGQETARPEEKSVVVITEGEMVSNGAPES